MVQEFSEYTELVQASNEEVDFCGGVIWHSTRLNGPSSDHDAPLPPGLHISSGIAKIWASSKECGVFESLGPSLSVVHVPEGGATFQTKLQAGPARSMGYYLPTAAMDTDDPVLASICKSALGKKLLNLHSTTAMMSVPRLNSLISSAYQGDIRRSLLKARALELTALIAAELNLENTELPSSANRRCAIGVRDLIERDLSRELHLEDFAQTIGSSVRTMTSAFRKTFNESISEYLRRRRMEEAAAALEQGATVAQAAFLVGYTPNAFSTAFKKHFGRNPSA